MKTFQRTIVILTEAFAIFCIALYNLLFSSVTIWTEATY